MVQTRHSLLAKGIMVLLSLLIMVFIFTYSWFYPPNAPATSSGIMISTSTEASFEMAIGFSTPASNGYVISQFYSSENIDFERVVIPATVTFTQANGDVYEYTNPTSGTINLLADFKPVDLTGDGVTLFRPEMEIKNRSIDYAATTVDHTIEANKQYISFDLYVRSSSASYSISLKEGSYVVGVCEATNKSLEVLATELAADPSSLTVSKSNEGAPSGTYSALVGDSVVRKSGYGNFSEDSVVGATRMAFTQYITSGVSDLGDLLDLLTGTNLNNRSLALSHLNSSSSLLWIPRPDIYLQDDPENVTSWVLHTANDADWYTAHVTDNDSRDFAVGDTYANEAAIHHYYNEAAILTAATNGNYAARFLTKSAVTDIATADDTSIINAISAARDNSSRTYGVCRVNLWVEGTDAEARRAIDGGAFFFGFDLSATS